MKKLITLIWTLCIPFFSYAQWTPQNVPYLVVDDADVVNNSTSYIICNNGDAGSSAIMKSNNGILTTVKASNNSLYKGCHFFNDQNGLICGAVDGKAVVWSTTDGGSTLNPIIISQVAFPYPTDFTFIDDNIGFLYSTSPFSGTIIYKTTDRGKTWQQVHESLFYTLNIRFLNVNLGHRLLSDGNLEVSKDGALTWQTVNIPNSEIHIQSFFFQSEQIGFITTEEGDIYLTNNAGVTWSRIAKLPSASILSINFSNNLMGFAIVNGADDYIIRTTDGGLTWKTVFMSSGSLFSGLNKLDIFDSNNVAAFGSAFFVKSSTASSATPVGRSTIFIEGNDTTCSNAMKIKMNFTGTPPWQVNLKDNFAKTTTVSVSQTPFTLNFTPLQVSNDEYRVEVVSLKGAGESESAIVGGAAVLNPIPSDAKYLNYDYLEACSNSTVSLPILLAGCAPWDLKISDDGRDTIITNIQTPNYVYKTLFTGNIQKIVKLAQVRRKDGDWKNLEQNEGHYTEQYINPKSTTSKSEFSAVNATEYCKNTEGSIIVNLEGVRPFNVSITDGVDTYSQISNSSEVIFKTTIKNSARWSIKTASDACGDLLKANSLDIRAKENANQPLNILAEYTTPNRDSLLVTWKDNNVGSKFKIGLNDEEIALGIQRKTISIYSIFKNNADSGKVVLRALNTETGCNNSAILSLASILRTYKKATLAEVLNGTGVVLADLNNDNLPDILCSNGFYINKGNFKFDFTAQNFGGMPTEVADLDNDNDLDFLVNNVTEGTTKVYSNNGIFNFTLKQTITGINATFFDYDYDNLIDILATQNTYKNLGNFQFSKIQELKSYGNVVGKPYYMDLDADGRLDFIDTYTDGQYQMILKMVRNDPSSGDWLGNQPVQTGSFIAKPVSICWGDLYGQGLEDCVVFCAPNTGEYTTDPYTNARTTSIFFKQSEGFGYTSLALNPPLQHQDLSGHGEGLLLDIDNNCNLEIFDTDALNFNSNFGERIFEGQKGFISKGAPASADLDNDGDLDIVVALPEGGLDVFENRFDLKNNWLKIKLNAQSANKIGIGKHIKVYFKDNNGVKRVITNTIGSRHGGLSKSDIVAHFGLCKAALIDSVKVIWTTGKVTVLKNIQVNQTLIVNEESQQNTNLSANFTILKGKSTTCKEPITLTIPSGNPPNTIYEWYNNGSLVSKSNTFTIASSSQNGTYSLLVKDTFNRIEKRSDLVQITILNPKSAYKIIDSIDCLGDKGLIRFAPSTQIEKVYFEQFKNGAWNRLLERSAADSLLVVAGKYRVISASIQDSTCKDISPDLVVIDSSFTINGKVILPNGTPSVSSTIKLFKIGTANSYSQVASIKTDSEGKYSFVSKSVGEYRILASPDNQIGLIPTYYGNTSMFNSAKSIVPKECKIYESNIQFLSVTGLDAENETNIKLKLLKNPIENEILISIETFKSEDLDIELYGIGGNLVQKWMYKSHSGSSIINLKAEVPASIYLLKFQNSKGFLKTFKVIK